MKRILEKVFGGKSARVKFSTLPADSLPIRVGVFLEGLPKDSYSGRALDSFARGVGRLGDKVIVAEGLEYRYCDVAVIFGDIRGGSGKEHRMRLKAEVKGRHIHRGLVVMDTPILTRASPIASEYRRIGIDAISRDEADFRNIGMLPHRWEALAPLAGLRMLPWRDSGTHIGIALQRPIDASLKYGEDRRPKHYASWVQQAVEDIVRATGRPILIRPHPGSLAHLWEREWVAELKKLLPPGVDWHIGEASFQDFLKDCWSCVTFTSGSAVEAVLAGVPSVAYGSGSFAWDVSAHDCTSLEAPLRPAREQWLHDLAYAEWSLAEMAEGEPWRHLRPKLLEMI